MPPEGTVDVWHACVSAMSAEFTTLANTLSPDEHHRACRYVFVKDRRRAIISRGLLKSLIGRYLATPPCRIAISMGDQGKPSIPHALQFNVTHSDDVIAFAFTARDHIGIDVERIERRLDVSRLARSIFSERELRLFDALAEGEQTDAFFASWTRKEAFLKAVGCGLTRPLTRVELGVDCAAKAHVLLNPLQPDSGSYFSIINFDLRDGYSAALAVERAMMSTIRMRDIEVDW